MADPNVGAFLAGLAGGYSERKKEQRLLKEQREAEERAHNRRLQEALDTRLYDMAMQGNTKAAQLLDQRFKLSQALEPPQLKSVRTPQREPLPGPFGPGSEVPSLTPQVDLGMRESARMSRPEDRPLPGRALPENLTEGSELWLRTYAPHTTSDLSGIDDARLVEDYRARGADVVTPEGRPVYDAMFKQYEQEQAVLDQYRRAQGIGQTPSTPGMVAPAAYDPARDVAAAGELLQQGQAGQFQGTPTAVSRTPAYTPGSSRDYAGTIPQFDEQSTRRDASPFEVQAQDVRAERERLLQEKRAEIEREEKARQQLIQIKQTEAQWDAIDKMAQEGQISPSELLKYTESKQAFQRGEADKWYAPQFREKPDRDRAERYRNQLGNSYARSIAFLNDDIAALDAKIKAGEQNAQEQINKLPVGQSPVAVEERWKAVKFALETEKQRIMEHRAKLGEKLSKLEGDEDLYSSYKENIPTPPRRETAEELLRNRESMIRSNMLQHYQVLQSLPFEDKSFWFEPGKRMRPANSTDIPMIQSFLSLLGLDPENLEQIKDPKLITERIKEVAEENARTEIEGVRPGELPPVAPPPPGQTGVAPQPQAQARPEMNDEQFEAWAIENPKQMTSADRDRLIQLMYRSK